MKIVFKKKRLKKKAFGALIHLGSLGIVGMMGVANCGMGSWLPLSFVMAEIIFKQKLHKNTERNEKRLKKDCRIC